jgi:hypothetical protein
MIIAEDPISQKKVDTGEAMKRMGRPIVRVRPNLGFE